MLSSPAPRPVRPAPDALPHLPLDYFVRALARPLRGVLLGGYLLLALLCGASLYFEYFPWAAVVEITALADTVTTPVVIDSITSQYRTFVWEGFAQASLVNYAASMVQVQPWLVLTLALSISVGWAFLLAATSRVQAWWAYGAYFVLGVWVINSNAAFVLVGYDPYRLYGLLLMLVLLVPAFLFRLRIWNANLVAQTGLYLGLFALWFGVAYARQGLAGLVHTAGFGWPVLVLVLVAFLLLFHREVLNVVLAAGLVHRDANRRQPAGVLLALVGLLWLVQLLLYLQHLRLLPGGEDPWLRPSHLFALQALAGLWTIGNLYGTVQERIPAVGAFYLGLLGLAIVSAGVVLFGLASGELLFRALLAENLLRINVIFQALYLLYLLAHFLPLLRRKANVYFGLMRPPRATAFGYTSIWFIGLSLLIFLEGRQHWRTTILARVTFANLAADYERLRGNDQSAATMYTVALDNARFDPKANHNLAALRLQADPTATVEELYANAEGYTAFPPARISHGNLLRARRLPAQAAEVLREAPAPVHPAVSVNLAAAWLALNQPDSAVVALQQALQADPNRGAAYANLGLVYGRTGRFADAQRFLAAGADVAPTDPYLLQNRIWLGLQADSLNHLLPPLPATPDTTLPAGARLNLAVLALHRRQWATADRLAQTLPPTQPEVFWLRLASQAHADSLPNALSRYAFLQSQVPQWASLAAQALGMAYVRRGMPEMAAPLLNEAAAFGQLTGGRTADSLAAAYLLADAGAGDSAALQLNLLAAASPAIAQAAAAETGRLLYAAGQPQLTLAMGGLAAPTQQDTLRIARHAGLLGHPTMALSLLGPIVERDSNALEAYLVMAEAWLAAGDPASAARDAAVGLARLSDAQRTDSLATQLAAVHLRALTLAGQTDAAVAAAQHQADTAQVAWQRARAQLALALGNTTQALQQLERLHQRQPYDVHTIVALGEAHLAQREFSRGLRVVGDALAWNDRNADLWLTYARLAAAIQSREEAEAALLRARQYRYRPDQRRQLDQLRATLLAPPAPLAAPAP